MELVLDTVYIALCQVLLMLVSCTNDSQPGS